MSKESNGDRNGQFGYQGNRREPYGFNSLTDYSDVDLLPDPRETASLSREDEKVKNLNSSSVLKKELLRPEEKPIPETQQQPKKLLVSEEQEEEKNHSIVHEEKNPHSNIPKAEPKLPLKEDKIPVENQAKTPQAKMGDGGGMSNGPEGEVEDLKADTTDSNSYVKSLTETSPSSFVKGMSKAGNDIAKARENENSELKESLPEVLQPTGLPVKEEEKKNGLEEPDKKEVPPIEVKGKVEGKKIQEGHEQPAPNNINIPSPKPKEGKILSEEIIKSINQLPVTDNGVNTNAGPRPPIDTSGQADPNQNEQNEQLADTEISELKVQSDMESKKDFGENDIYPDIKQEILKPGTELSKPVEYSPADGLALPPMDQETIHAFDEQAQASFDEKSSVEMAKADDQKAKMEQDSQKERENSDKKIKEETENTEKKQKAEQLKAKADVKGQRDSWQKENADLQSEFKKESASKKSETQGKIDSEIKTTEAKVDTELTQAENKAKEEKSKTDQEAAQKKADAKNKPKSFWDKVTDAVSDFFDALKSALNSLFDKLRAFVKSVIEAAKKLVNKLIDMARNAIIGLIKAFGELLKKLVNVLLAKFPALRKKINAWIDKAVNVACAIVNKLADALKKAVNFLLDALGKVLDMILAAYQAFYNMILDGLAFIAVGLIKIMKGIANLVSSAKQSPGNFWGQMSEEMLGTDITKPLPNERPALDESNLETTVKNQVEEGSMEQGDANLLAKKKYSPDDFKVEPVAGNLELDPQLSSQLAKNGEDGSYEFGHQDEKENDIEAVKQDVLQPEEEASSPPAVAASVQTPGVDDGLVGPFKGAMERGAYMLGQMKKGIVEWWGKNKVKIIAALVLGILGVVLANVITGGAIMAALPVIMELMSVYFLADTIFNVGKHFGAYLSASWPGNIVKGAISLARAMAIAAFEIATALLFGAKGAIKGVKNAAKSVAKNGVKGAMKQGLKTAKNSLKAGVKETFQNVKKLASIAKDGGKNIVKNGKILYHGIADGFAKGSKNLDDLGKRLGQRLKFKKFKLVVKKWKFSLFGEVNPWVLLASGKIAEIDEDALKKLQKEQGSKSKLGLKTTVDGEMGVVIGAEKDASNLVKHLEGNAKKGGKFLDQNKELADEILSKGLKGGEVYHAATSNIIKNTSEAQNMLKRGMDPGKLNKIVNNGLSHGASDMTTLLSQLERLQKFNIGTFDRFVAELAHSQKNKFKGAEWILEFVSSKSNTFLAKIEGFEIIHMVGTEVRRFDAVIDGVKYEFKNWGDFTNLGDLVNQIRKDFDAGGQALSGFKYVFSKRIGEASDVLEKIGKKLPEIFDDPVIMNQVKKQLETAIIVGT